MRAAYCDVDGTLARTTIVTPLMWLKRCQVSPALYRLWQASLLLRGPWWLLLDKISRQASNRAIYSHYRGMPCQQLKSRAARCYDECIRPRLYPQALTFLAQLQRESVQLVLVTGGIDFLLQPLADQLDAQLIAPSLKEEDGFFTGELSSLPLTGQGKADAIRQHSAKSGLDLKDCYALGDAAGDLAMLEAVGSPIACNPDRRLAAIAAQRGWTIKTW